MRWIFLAAVVALAGCEDGYRRDPNRPIIERVYRSPGGEMDVWQDRETGCQYLSYTSTSGLTARVGRDGKAICVGRSNQ